MRKLSISIIHRFPNRLRVRLSLPMKEPKSFFTMIRHNINYLEFKYNKKTKTLTVKFNPDEIFLQEILYRIAIAFSVENGLMPVKLLEENNYKSISPLSLYALASISLSGFNKIISKKDIKLQNYMDYLSMGLTVGSVFEHAYGEVKRNGIFDIEILPAMYLVKSFVDSPKLSSVLIMWLTTFGRHLVISKNIPKVVKVYRIKNQHGYQYTANISDDNSVETLSDFLYHIFFKKHEGCYGMNEKYVTLSNY
ncbi:MAG: hypothetical protein KGV57_01235 [Fusobacterium sp.]|nr:hypothetical protein [Fusobacterium sp.]